MAYDGRVTLEQANAPRPKPPEFYAPLWQWQYYFSDLACWIATQADKFEFGIVEEIQNSELKKESV